MSYEVKASIHDTGFEIIDERGRTWAKTDDAVQAHQLVAELNGENPDEALTLDVQMITFRKTKQVYRYEPETIELTISVDSNDPQQILQSIARARLICQRSWM